MHQTSTVKENEERDLHIRFAWFRDDFSFHTEDCCLVKKYLQVFYILLLLGPALDDASFTGKGLFFTELLVRAVSGIFFVHSILFNEGLFQAVTSVDFSTFIHLRFAIHLFIIVYELCLLRTYICSDRTGG
jgi:hypothetical protein